MRLGSVPCEVSLPDDEFTLCDFDGIQRIVSVADGSLYPFKETGTKAS